MIKDMLRLIEAEIGVRLPADSATRVQMAIGQKYGGTEVYVEKAPKLAMHARILAIGTGVRTSEVARQLNVDPSYVRKVRRLLIKKP